MMTQFEPRASRLIVRAAEDHMTDAFHAKLQCKIADYHTWAAGRRLSGCRLVHYCGVDLLGAQDLLLTEVEASIAGLVCEGFYVDWAEDQGQLFLRVWEFGGPEPEWPKVFAEQPLADIDKSLRGIDE